MSGGESLEHIAHGVCNPAKDAASTWWLDPITVGQMASPQLEGDLHPLFYPHGPPSPIPIPPPLPQLFSSQGVPTSTRRKFWQSRQTLRENTPTFVIVYVSLRRCPSPETTPFWRTVQIRWSTDWEGFTAESERRFAETPLPTSCPAWEKAFSFSLVRWA